MTEYNESMLISFIKQELNEPQRNAVMHTHGPLLIVAGAGSGKTRIITARVSYLVCVTNAAPESIVALTFTNKAAREMKQRVNHFIGERSHHTFIGTFHAYCLRLLKTYYQHASFSLLDEDDQTKIIRSILHKNNLHKQFTPRQIGYQISYVKNQLTDPETPIQSLITNPLVIDIYRAYEDEKKISNCFDFDDLLLETIRLFKNDAQFKTHFQENIRHVLVDEYQDTNLVQHELLKHMTKNADGITAQSVCAVGDEDQSIYSWRGATIANILNFKRDFAGTTIIKIEQNYRSVQPVLETANAVIKNNMQRTPKKLWSARPASNRIYVLRCLSEYQEADIASSYVKEALSQDKTVALLYRTHAQSRALEEALIKHSIPYTIVGGVQFYERREIRDLLAYLRLAVNPFDRPSFSRIINIPARGLGQKFEEGFLDAWRAEPFLTFKQIAQRMIDEQQIVKSKKDALNNFIRIMNAIDPKKPATDALETIIKETQYFTYLKDNCEPTEAQSRIENVKELITAARHFFGEGLTDVESFLHEIALLQDKINNTQNEEKRAILMTLHAAKGLEFDFVCLSGLEESLLPSSRSHYDDNALEEERRLLYVGITRAKEYLLVIYARYRCIYGQMTNQHVSRFVQEMPNACIKQDDASEWGKTEQKLFLHQWLTGKQKEKIAYSPSKTITNKKIEPASSAWKKNQPVHHSKYGVGIIQNIEPRTNGESCLTIKFKSGSKKIMSSFIRAV